MVEDNGTRHWRSRLLVGSAAKLRKGKTPPPDRGNRSENYGTLKPPHTWMAGTP